MLGSPSCVVQKERRKPLNLFKLFILLNQKHPPYHPTFQRAILAKFPVQFNSICILFYHCLRRFPKFPDSYFEPVMVNS